MHTRWVSYNNFLLLFFIIFRFWFLFAVFSYSFAFSPVIHSIFYIFPDLFACICRKHAISFCVMIWLNWNNDKKKDKPNHYNKNKSVKYREKKIVLLLSFNIFLHICDVFIWVGNIYAPWNYVDCRCTFGCDVLPPMAWHCT